MLTQISAVVLDLTFRDVVAGIPHDAGSFVAYTVIALFGFAVWRGSRASGKS